jgi:hypothetical protein
MSQKHLRLSYTRESVNSLKTAAAGIQRKQSNHVYAEENGSPVKQTALIA